jgi:hypothetical protein
VVRNFVGGGGEGEVVYAPRVLAVGVVAARL